MGLVPKKVRHELNRLYRMGEITKKQLMDQMRNGLFDHERLAMKKKLEKILGKEE
ncbi:hypothetical protein [Thermoflavimicrobium dichotomicum]|uniref:Uncharacterized protein n=1 Tax=Thermoflavimicrobium dichotomicum TaxID=46223 RepID=A0A1I3P0T7_9BACL|nr:hypothetical protein [Thermoflavimicrobium dichotomicum]SFJ15175.1 hypothetical protein SAMN05421852_10548 [Thermoflavimicrobium dichotomicum]